MSRIAFRLDASSTIGSGHFSRCLTLANALRTGGGETLFISRELPKNFVAKLVASGHGLAEISASTVDQDARESNRILNGFSPDWLVVDHYKLDAKWEDSVRENCPSIFAIDDKADRPHSCDMLLDQNFNPKLHTNYRALTQSHTRLLLGPRFALLPPVFASIRSKRGAVTGKVERILICFGGSDPRNHTASAIEAVRPFISRLTRIDVAIGSLHKNKDEIASLCKGISNIRLHCPAENIADLMCDADLAIGAGGVMNWERACLGLPSLAFGIVDNQVAILDALCEAGIVGGQASTLTPDKEAVSRWLGIALDNPAFVRGLSARSTSLVDGLGTERVSRLLMPVALRFRPATIADSEQLLRWRNSPEIRRASTNSEEISQKEHGDWLLETLSNPFRQLLIAENNNIAIGVVRFDLNPPQATISIYRAPDQQLDGIRLVEQATTWFLLQNSDIGRIVANVKSTNQPSLSAFRTAGYIDTSTSLVFEREAS